MADTKIETRGPANELRAAAEKLREGPTGPAVFDGHTIRCDGEDIAGCDACRVAAEFDHPELLAGLLNARLHIAAWLGETAADYYQDVIHAFHADCDGVVGEDCVCFARPLAVARVILGGGHG